MERGIIKHLPEAWELADTRLQTDTHSWLILGCRQTHTVHDIRTARSFLLGIAYRRVKTQSALQGTALDITVCGKYSYRCALPGYGNSALLQ